MFIDDDHAFIHDELVFIVEHRGLKTERRNFVAQALPFFSDERAVIDDETTFIAHESV